MNYTIKILCFKIDFQESWYKMKNNLSENENKVINVLVAIVMITLALFIVSVLGAGAYWLWSVVL